MPNLQISQLSASTLVTNLWVAIPRERQTVFYAMVCYLSFSSKQCIIKQLLDSGFAISRIIKVSVSAINLDLRLG